MSYDLILRILEYSGLVTKGSDLTPAEVDENFLSLLECCTSRSSSSSQTGGISDNTVDVIVSENGTNNTINVNAGTYLESFNVSGTGFGRLLINNLQVNDLTINVAGIDEIVLSQNENVEFLFLDEEYFLLNSGINKNFDSMLEKTEFDDWFLGSKEEFEALQSTLGALEEYRTLYSLGLLYWTSTEVDKDTAKVIDMETGDIYDAPKNMVATTYDELYTIPTSTNFEVVTLTALQDFVLLTKTFADYTANTMNYIINCGEEPDYFGLSKEFNHFATGTIMDLDGLTIQGVTFGVTENTPNSSYTITVANGTKTHIITLTNFEGNLGNIYTPKTRAIRSFESTDEHEIGDFAGGGYVFHKIDPDSSDPLAIKTYYVMAKEDTTSDYVYGTMDLLIGASGEAIGTGADNTELLLENDTTGAGVYLETLEYETDNDSNYIQPKDSKRFKIRDIDPSFTEFKEDIDVQYDDGQIPIWDSILEIWKRLRLTDLFSILKTYFDNLYQTQITNNLEYLFEEIDTADVTYYYLGYTRSNGSWRIKRVTRATYVVGYATGDTDYATNWTNRSSLTYS